ncbi:MAG: protein kinase [archaeon]|nr:protein kinase [archaeon]
MGNRSETIAEPKTIYIPEEEQKLTKSSFDFLSIIGRGGFGKVWKVSCKKYNKIFAMKEMSKTKIIDKRSEKSIKSERDLLSRMNHPFIINMHFAFQDKDNLYLVMDYLTGGDLRYHISKVRRFSEEQTKFFIACMLLGLEYCHFNNIIHRDIKPENLVLDSNGYVKVTDFGIAKIQRPGNAKETSGTPGYMSPEVMVAQDHTIAVDYFAIGVIGYEFMKGVRPYLGKSRKEIKEKIMAHQACIKPNTIVEGWSMESADCINKLLQRKPNKRLGYHGAKEVKEHQWFNGFPWKDLYNMRLSSPFVPKSAENFDYKYCNAVEKLGVETQEKYANIMSSSNYRTAFEEYYYFNRLSNKNKNLGEPYISPHDNYEDNNIRRNQSSNDSDYGIANSNHAFCAANSFVMQRSFQKKTLSGEGNTTGSSNSTKI